MCSVSTMENSGFAESADPIAANIFKNLDETCLMIKGGECMKTDIEIAQEAKMEPIKDVAAKLSINEDELQTTLLFIHAQDTLITINSEVNLTQNMIRLYRKLEK